MGRVVPCPVRFVPEYDGINGSGVFRFMRRLSAINPAGITLALLVLALSVARPVTVAGAAGPPISKETQECLNCHSQYHPGLVQDWMHSLHSHVTPEQALKKRPAEQEGCAEREDSRCVERRGGGVLRVP